jgi:hypothetical protein
MLGQQDAIGGNLQLEVTLILARILENCLAPRASWFDYGSNVWRSGPYWTPAAPQDSGPHGSACCADTGFDGFTPTVDTKEHVKAPRHEVEPQAAKEDCPEQGFASSSANYAAADFVTSVCSDSERSLFEAAVCSGTTGDTTSVRFATANPYAALGDKDVTLCIDDRTCSALACASSQTFASFGHEARAAARKKRRPLDLAMMASPVPILQPVPKSARKRHPKEISKGDKGVSHETRVPAKETRNGEHDQRGTDLAERDDGLLVSSPPVAVLATTTPKKDGGLVQGSVHSGNLTIAGQARERWADSSPLATDPHLECPHAAFASRCREASESGDAKSQKSILRGLLRWRDTIRTGTPDDAALAESEDETEETHLDSGGPEQGPKVTMRPVATGSEAGWFGDGTFAQTSESEAEVDEACAPDDRTSQGSSFTMRPEQGRVGSSQTTSGESISVGVRPAQGAVSAATFDQMIVLKSHLRQFYDIHAGGEVTLHASAVLSGADKIAWAQAGWLDDGIFVPTSESDAEGDEVCAPGNRSSVDLASDHPRPSAGAAAVRQAPSAGKPQRKKGGRGRPLKTEHSKGST